MGAVGGIAGTLKTRVSTKCTWPGPPPFIRSCKAAFRSFVKGEIGDLTTLIYDAREHVFERLKSDAAAVGAEEVVGIKTYIIELGSSLIEIFAVGTAVTRSCP